MAEIVHRHDSITATTRRSPLAVLAVAVAGLTICAVIVSVLVWLARGMVAMPVSFGSSPIGVLGLVISPICYAAVGGVLGARLPSSPIGWLFLAMGAALGIMLPVNLMVAAAHESFRPADPLVVWLAWIRTTLGTPVVLTAAVVAVQVFPDGHTLGGRWRIGPWIGVAGGALLVAATGLDPVGLVTYPSIPNPMAAPYGLREAFAMVRLAAVVLLIGSAAIAVASVRRRHAAADAILRAQLRWIVVAVVITVVVAVPFVIARYLLRVTDATGELLAAMAQIGAVAFPLAAALAISRYRLFDVDIVVGRSLVYLPLTAVLGGLYTAGIALFQRLFVAVTGSESDVAIVMTVLVVASAFTPIRRWLEGFVDRRFAAHLGTTPTAAAASPVGAPSLPLPGRAPASPMSMRPPVHAVLARVDEAGRVDCPLAAGRTLRDCVPCRRRIAFVDQPDVAVVCDLSSTD